MALATVQHTRTVTTADDGWYRTITSFADRTGWLHRPIEVYTTASIVLLVVMTAVAWWYARSRSNPRDLAAVAWVGIGAVLCVAGGLLLKQVFQETRPCQALMVHSVQACPGPTDYSFPSDHMTVAVALAVGLWIVNRTIGLVAVALAALEGFSRIYLGQHYPHDVIGAIILSCVVMLVGWRLASRPLTRLIEALGNTRLRPLLSVGAPPLRRRSTLE
ncbi:phosphatase PAP2 family protein [Nocardioides sp. BP30]|uniref:phosphatase PAP2 family protein n=1 Tax=Nocardioides sp. BP30 TaxID=3036374 RepID=UPI002468C9C4|nr:phosphatase PAP2 family protein [Nocardioides sp. BP30]WGL52493.1 phosphatase PAP2 family protein [Nocardioides sp. BP30]